MNKTTENFWAVWNSLEPYNPPQVFWRLYYDDQGHPLLYSQDDMPGNYIDVTPEQYQRANMRVRVQDGQLVELKTKTTAKLTPGPTGTPCDPCDVSVVVTDNKQHIRWSRRVRQTD